MSERRYTHIQEHLPVIATCGGLYFAGSSKKTKIGNWLSMNAAKLVLFYGIIVISLISIRTEIIWTFDKMENILGLEWSIFGVSVTIFLVWNVLMVEYLNEKKPRFPVNALPTKISLYIQNKGNYYEQVTRMFISVTFLTLNLFVLVVSTTGVYIMYDDINLLNQNLVILSFYFCTNTIAGLFTDMLAPLKDKKKALLEGTKVTSSDQRNY